MKLKQLIKQVRAKQKIELIEMLEPIYLGTAGDDIPWSLLDKSVGIIEVSEDRLQINVYGGK